MEKKEMTNVQLLAALKTIQANGAEVEVEYVATLIRELEGTTEETKTMPEKDVSVSIPNKTRIVIHIDGGSRGNPGPSGCGCVINLGDRKWRVNKFLGHGTNNEAEYSGILLAVEKLQSLGIKDVDVDFFADSQLTMKQMSGEFRIKEPRMQVFADKIRTLITSLNIRATFTQIPREQNAEADKLTNMAMDSKPIDAEEII